MMNRQHPPAWVAKSMEIFSARLAANGAKRGFRAERKSDSTAAVYIYDVIGKDFWTGDGVDEKDILAELDGMKGAKQLDIYINSPGGNVWSGKAIYNQLMRFPAQKTVHVDGIAASAASLIAMAGDKIITEPGGTWLIHRVSCGAYGFSEDLRAMADQIDVETVSIRGIYEQRTGKSSAELDAWMREDKICDAVTAKARGLTDEISEVDQRRADAAEAAAARAAPSALSPAALIAQARARVLAINDKFPGASPGTNPGQPGPAKKGSR